MFEKDYQTSLKLKELITDKQPLTEDEFINFVATFNQLQWKTHDFYNPMSPLDKWASYFSYCVDKIHNPTPDHFWKAVLIKIDTTQKLLEEVKKGRKFFINIDLEDAQNFENQDLSKIHFRYCSFTASFKKATFNHTFFYQCNLKTCNFSEADLTDARIRECLIDGTGFLNANIEGLLFEGNYVQGATVNENYLLDFKCVGEPKKSIEKEKFVKSAEAIRNQILHRFEKQSSKNKEDYISHQYLKPFTTFDLQTQDYINRELKLNKHELIAILYLLNQNQYFVITTERIIIKDNQHINIIKLTDYAGCGFRSIDRFSPENPTLNLAKEEGHLLKFSFFQKNQPEIKIDMPSGHAGYALWNTSVVLKLIGEKYIIKEYLEEM